MIDLVRKEIGETADTVVVKIGSSVLTRDDGTLDATQVSALAEQVHALRTAGRRVVVVSSGAVAAGLGLLGLPRRPHDLPHLQAAAAVGQNYLMRCYDVEFRRHGTHAAQLLLTAEDIDNRTRYLNVRNTLLTLFEYGVVPVINENDSVSVDEICFGDNDRLAAMITNLLAAPLLVMLTVVEGLYTGGPPQECDAKREAQRPKLVPLIRDLDHTTFALAAPTFSRQGKGGMQSKLEAARMATAAGASVLIANGKRLKVLQEILVGEQIGTLVLAQGTALTAWKRWIGFSVRPRGHFVVDSGARNAIERLGKSLLPAGVVDVVGQFRKGDVVSLQDKAGAAFARGLSNYSAADAKRIKGLQTHQIHNALGTNPYDEVIHRDNLVITA